MKRKLWLVWGMVLMIAFALTACSSNDDENKSSAKAITVYSLGGYPGTINEGAKTIAINVPYGTPVTAMVASFTTTGSSVKVGSVVQTTGSTTNNFASPVSYKVTAEDGSSVTYTVTVTIALSTTKAITAYSLGGHTGTINEGAKTIAVSVPNGTDVTTLVATFTTTGASVKVGSVVQTTGSTKNDFTSPVTYIVAAADSSTQNYVVTVTVVLEGTWTQKTAFGGIARDEAVGFFIGAKGYVGTGWDGSSYYKDFWEYDPIANTWTQKADFSGVARRSAVGFSIGSKGYLGTGENGSGYQDDFYVYDPSTNLWTIKATFGGTKRKDAVGFGIGSKGYIGTGQDGVGYTKDFWEYDPTADTWTKKADFGGGNRASAVGLCISSKGYIGTGWDGTVYYKDFWEFDPTANTWTRKADFGGEERISAVALYSTCSNGYVGLGQVPCYNFNDFWEYDPVTDKWTRRADFAGGERASAVAFSISDSHYVGTGINSTTYFKDLWMFVP